MGKNKLRRWAELEEMEMVIQPPVNEAMDKEHDLKGNWHSSVFNNSNPIILELGCGKGEYTTGLGAKYPQNNFIGIDIKGARMWRGARTAKEAGLKNVAFLRTRIEFIKNFFAGNEVDEIWVTFPDPQLKRRRNKKRLTGAIFLNNYRSFLKDSGVVHLKTDNRKLYDDTLALVKKCGLKIITSSADLYNEEPCDASSIQTFYEKIYREKGVPICYLSFHLTSAIEAAINNDEE